MSLELVRVDDRLIHGQVVVGWGQVLNPDLFVIVDDDVAQNEWEQEIYRMGVLTTQEVEFTSLTRLCEAAPTIRQVNLGGVHHERDRRLHLPYLFLDDTEVDQLLALAERGLEISAQDLPTAARVNLEDLL